MPSADQYQNYHINNHKLEQIISDKNLLLTTKYDKNL